MKTTKEIRMKTLLGNTYRDKVTGYTGVCIGRCDYLTGASSAQLAPPVGENCKDFDEGEWFEERRLEELDVPPVTLDHGGLSIGFYQGETA